MSDTHIHDCTGQDGRCYCGFVFTVPPVYVSIEIGHCRDVLYSDSFNCYTIAVAVAALRKAADNLEVAEAAGVTQTPRRVQ